MVLIFVVLENVHISEQKDKKEGKNQMKNKTSILSKLVNNTLKQASLLLVGAVIMIAGFSSEAMAFRLRNDATNLCLDGFNGGGNRQPYQFTCQPNNPFQQWDRIERITFGDFDQFNLRNRGTGLCLDAFAFNSQGNGARPYFFTCQTGNDFQRWSVNLGQSGAKNIRTVGGTSLDGFNGGGNIFPYLFTTNTNNKFQRWFFE